MLDIIKYLEREYELAGGIENYIDINIAQAPDCFDATMVSDAKARLLREGIAVSQIDKERLIAIDKILNNTHYKRFNDEEILYTIQNARLMLPAEIATKLNKDFHSVEKIVRKIKALV